MPFFFSFFFYDDVHSQTTLKEFVDQFDNALKKMVENEAHADFDCLITQFMCSQSVFREAIFRRLHKCKVKRSSPTVCYKYAL
jgi:hypothetical protein